ncbi:MAG: hypothetical protein H6822_08265 [Planctomycetaceae bacterium]|nr:hypothetical protein [Planctomycetales bacterium]MCB9922162.1 hypothetical protein [Planctomycetaceae bacterium]
MKSFSNSFTRKGPKRHKVSQISLGRPSANLLERIGAVAICGFLLERTRSHRQKNSHIRLLLSGLPGIENDRGPPRDRRAFTFTCIVFTGIGLTYDMPTMLVPPRDRYATSLAIAIPQPDHLLTYVDVRGHVWWGIRAAHDGGRTFS